MGNVLRVDHCADSTNQYAQAFREKLIFRDFSKNFPNHRLIETLDSKAVRLSIGAALNQNRVDFISAAGHGSYDAFTGFDGKAIWHSTQTANGFKGKIVHLLACDAGAMLGRSIIENGGSAFWGYTTHFTFRHSKHIAPIEADSLAEAYFRMDAIIDRGVLTGKNSKEIYSSIAKYVAYLMQKSTSFNDPIDRGLLLSNFVHLACPVITWGDGTAVIR